MQIIAIEGERTDVHAGTVGVEVAYQMRILALAGLEGSELEAARDRWIIECAPHRAVELRRAAVDQMDRNLRGRLLADQREREYQIVQVARCDVHVHRLAETPHVGHLRT